MSINQQLNHYHRETDLKAILRFRSKLICFIIVSKKGRLLFVSFECSHKFCWILLLLNLPLLLWPPSPDHVVQVLYSHHQDKQEWNKKCHHWKSKSKLSVYDKCTLNIEGKRTTVNGCACLQSWYKNSLRIMPICWRALLLCSMLVNTTISTLDWSVDFTLSPPPPSSDSMSISMSPMSSMMMMFLFLCVMFDCLCFVNLNLCSAAPCLSLCRSAQFTFLIPILCDVERRKGALLMPSVLYQPQHSVTDISQVHW